MPLVSTKEMLLRAQREGYAVVGIAAYNLETVQTAVATAELWQAPLMIQTTSATIENAGIEYISAIVRIAAEKAHIPVALHLDHGDSLERVNCCLEFGYTSVMIDGSHLPFEENVQLACSAVEMAHARGVMVEAELGQVGGVEDELTVENTNALYTDPDLAEEYVQRTGVDSLAIAIGTAHGLYRGIPRLDFNRLSEIRERVSVPLVLHGASGVPDELIREAIHRGIAKINIATELKIPFVRELRAFLGNHPDEIDPRKYFLPARKAYAQVVEEKIKLAGANGRYPL